MNTLITYFPVAIFMILAAIGGSILPQQIKIAKKNDNLILGLIVQIVTLIATAYISYGFHAGLIDNLLDNIGPYWKVGVLIFVIISVLGTVYFLGSYWGTSGPFVSGISLGYFLGLYLFDPQYAVHGFISVLVFFFFLLMGIIISKKYKIQTEE